LGFDHAWLGDHFAISSRPTQAWFEAWTLLAALATQTTRLRIGALVSSIAWRNPAFLARQAMTVDHISQGRLELGLGPGVAGGKDRSHAMAGLEDWPPAERVARFHEVVEIVDQLLCNKVTTYQGRYYELVEAGMCPAPIQQPRPPLVLAAHGKMALKTVAQYADTWNSFGGYAGTPDEILETTRQRNELLDAYCAEIGRDPRAIRRSLLVYPSVARKPFASVEAFQQVVGRYLEIGITEFIFYYPADEERAVFERIARDVIPSLRANAG